MTEVTVYLVRRQRHVQLWSYCMLGDDEWLDCVKGGRSNVKRAAFASKFELHIPLWLKWLSAWFKDKTMYSYGVIVFWMTSDLVFKKYWKFVPVWSLRECIISRNLLPFDQCYSPENGTSVSCRVGLKNWTNKSSQCRQKHKYYNILLIVMCLLPSSIVPLITHPFPSYPNLQPLYLFHSENQQSSDYLTKITR